MNAYVIASLFYVPMLNILYIIMTYVYSKFYTLTACASSHIAHQLFIILYSVHVSIPLNVNVERCRRDGEHRDNKIIHVNLYFENISLLPVDTFRFAHLCSHYCSLIIHFFVWYTYAWQ
jgi:hypothetical protein